MLTKRCLDSEDARRMVEDAFRRAEAIKTPMCIAVVDNAGVLISFLRMDGAKITSVPLAIDKAFTAAGAQNETEFYGDESNPNSPTWRINGTNGGRFSTIGGGVPVIVDGQVVGGFAVGGGTIAQDIEIAKGVLADFLSSVA